MSTVDTDRTSRVVALAERHGLTVDADSVTFNDAGLDYQVAFATAQDQARWVLRIPRRDDVADKIVEEDRILRLVRGELSVLVPDWRIQSRELIAYPSLPGEPGLTMSDAGEPVWHFDREDPHYARALGVLIAELHRIDPRDVGEAGVPVESPAEVRDGWRTRLAQVEAEFTIADELRAGWHAWLADDRLWPDATVFTHGELYPAHLLLDEDGTIRSVLDWTTAKVSDPALEFMYHFMLSTPETFQVTVDAYGQTGGQPLEHLPERCAALLAAGPLNYAAYALTTGDPEHAATAAAQLNPAP